MGKGVSKVENNDTARLVDTLRVAMGEERERAQHPSGGSPTRRAFLATTGAVAAGAALAATSSAEETPLRVGVVGTGSRGCDLIRKLATIDGARIVAVCDDYAPHLKLGKEYAGDGAEAYADFARMLAAARLDAVVIATPLYLHAAMATDAIEKGIAVFCEKTMCYSTEEAKRLADLVERHDAIFQVGLQRRSNAIYDQAEAMVHAGMLGTVTTIDCQWHRNDDWKRDVPAAPGHADYDALDRRLNWRLYDRYSRGLMAELASHQLDVANRLLRCAPVRAIGSGGIDYYTDGREVCDHVHCIYEYECPDAGAGKAQTVRVTFSSIQTNAYAGVSEVVMGTKGTLFLTQKKALFYVEGKPATPSGDVDGMSGATLAVSNNPWAHRSRPVEIDSDDDDTRAELVSFLDDVRSGNRATACTARVGLENTATIMTGHEAIRTGTPVPFPEDCRALHA